MKRTAALVAVAALATATTIAAQSESGNGDRLAKAAIEAKEKTFSGDAQVGWDLFREKNCIRCHAVWGQGGEVGPDLGRTRTAGHVSAGQLAGMMWNHVPRMWEKMEEGGK